MKKLTTEEFIAKAKLIHGDKYDYRLCEYINNRLKIKIICPIHGEFIQTAMNHLAGRGCIYCKEDINKERFSILNKMSQNVFIEKAIETHGNRYDYSLVEYVNNRLKIKIICPIHGEFKQSPNHHLRGCGCQHCNLSKGELTIKRFLEDKLIDYIPQKTFDDCKGRKNKLPFDFYIPNYNLLIEYQGEQHYMIKEHWGGEKEFIKLQVTDKLKKDYCTLKDIRLLEITYKDDSIKVLEEFLRENSPNTLLANDLIESP